MKMVERKYIAKPAIILGNELPSGGETGGGGGGDGG